MTAIARSDRLGSCDGPTNAQALELAHKSAVETNRHMTLVSDVPLASCRSTGADSQFAVRLSA
jgi:hypothetical protein